MSRNLQESLFVEELWLPNKIGSASVAPSSIRSLLNEGKGSIAAYDYTLNAYRGCTFGCAYCYAPSFESRSDMADSWGTWVEVKRNAVDILTGVDLRGKSVFMSSVTDPYQPVEAKVGLTRQIVETLLEKKCRLVVQTRSPLVARDLDLISQFESTKVNVSIPTNSDEVRKIYEPAAPSIDARLRTIRKLKDHGITASVCISPMLPVLDPLDFASRLNDSGADFVTATWFHRSEKAFTATTRAGAFGINALQDWNYARYQRVCDVLAEHCPAFGSSGRAFGPANAA